MPAYKYEALDNAGKPRQGLLEADNPRAARAQLRGQGLVPMEVQPVAAPKSSSRWSRRVFNGSGLSVWTRQLAGLVAAGLPLERSLAALADEADDPRQRDLMSSLKAEVNAGSPFARALGTAPREFDDVYRAVVAAGEQSGALGPVLESLADDLEETQRLRSELFGALAYPIIVCFISLLAVGFLLTYVVPQVAAVFTQTRQTLPLLTRLMMGTSDLLRQWGLLLIGLVVVGGFAVRQTLKKEGPRQRFDAAWLNLPVIGRISRGYNAARFSGTLAMLAGGGCAHPEGTAGGSRDAVQPRHARRCDGRAGAGARRCAAGGGPGGQEAVPRTAVDVCPPRRADRSAARHAAARRTAAGQ